MSVLAICLVAAHMKVRLPTQEFTLSWMHSVEKITWSEHYRLQGNHLVLDLASVQGSGAGMEPPEGAVFNPKTASWEYVPKLPPLKSLNLARSHFTKDYQICYHHQCHSMGHWIPIDVSPSVQVQACP